MMKNLNEQLNIDLKNGTWSISTSDDNLVAGTPVVEPKPTPEVGGEEITIDITNTDF